MLINLDIDNTYINPDYVISLSLVETGNLGVQEWVVAANMINGKIMTLRTFKDYQEAEVFLNKFIEETNNISRGSI